jgi:hypothetical protein
MARMISRRLIGRSEELARLVAAFHASREQGAVDLSLAAPRAVAARARARGGEAARRAGRSADEPEPEDDQLG